MRRLAAVAASPYSIPWPCIGRTQLVVRWGVVTAQNASNVPEVQQEFLSVAAFRPSTQVDTRGANIIRRLRITVERIELLHQRLHTAPYVVPIVLWP